MLMLSPTPLPRVPHSDEEWKKTKTDLDYSGAYDFVLKSEVQAEAGDQIIHARVAGYLLIELFDRQGALTLEPYRCVVGELMAKARTPGGPCELVFDIGKMYRDRLLRLFRTTNTSNYPIPSQHPSPPVFDTVEEMTRDIMEADEKDYRTSERKALARDGYRCLLTGFFDELSLEKSLELKLKRKDLISKGFIGKRTGLEACHILGESTMQGVDPAGGTKGSAKEAKTSRASNAMAILKTFGLDHLYEKLLPENGVHDVGNILTLEHNCHRDFDRLNLWLEATDEPDRYRVCNCDAGNQQFLRTLDYLEKDHLNRLYVTFPRCDVGAPLPDPKLLALQAVCARVAHMSGAAEAFNELDYDVEDAFVLSSDGSSARLLDHVLTPFASTLV